MSAKKLLVYILLGVFFAPVPILAEETVIEEIVVFGSRIQKPDWSYSNPVLSIERDMIAESGTTNIVNFLKTIPALTGSLSSNDGAGSNAFIGGSGLSALNLRNLGVERTLTLVDSKRHVAGLPGTAVVDVDTIPIDLIERVEILTGGASAVYGADGVSGVVNFVMKDHFEGVRVRAQGGTSGDNDAESALLSVAAGMNFADGRGNISGAIEYTRENRLRASDRDFASDDIELFVTNPFDEVPNRIPLGDIRFFDSSPDGAFDTDADFGEFTGTPDFNGDSAWNAGTIPFIPPFYQQGGDGSRVDMFTGDLLPKEERGTFNLLFDYEFTQQLQVFADFKYSNTSAFSESQPSFDFFIALEPDYAYLTPNISSAFEQAVLDGSFDPFGFGAPGPLVSRDHFDMGIRGEDIERETIRSVLGIEGDFDNGWNYEVSYVYGQTKVDNRTVVNRFNDRFAAALDAVIDPDTNEAVCRSNLDPDAEPVNLQWMGWGFDYEPRPGTWAGSFDPGPASGCLPLNVIGDGSASGAAAAWINQTTLDTSEINQHVVQAYLAGDTTDWFSLPAGAIDFVVGAEYRKEESKSNPAPEDQAGYTFGNILEPVEGDFDVSEFFFELNVPLLVDLPAAESLVFDTAVRLSDYSTIGDATTWKVGLAWQPIQDIVVRSTVAEATRSPNIGELFDPGGQTFEFIDDPCDVTRLENGTENRADNCASVLTALGVDPDTFVDPNSFSIPGTLAGNPELDEEISDTVTVGVIFQPRFAENLVVTVDWYDIKLKDAINTATPQEAADLCVDLADLNNQFCNLAEREAGTGAYVDFVQKPVNVAEFRTRGIDFTAFYSIDPTNWGAKGDWGIFSINLIGNYLDKLTFVSLPDSDPVSERGEVNSPKWQANLDFVWERGGWRARYDLDYFDKTARFSQTTRENNPDIADREYWDYDQKLVHNAHLSYDWTNFRLSGGINNFTNEKPDIGETFYPVSAVGRYYYLGFEFAM
jgi:outer membrane receptor protein involved in Fe transport